ncbi:MAG: substrate-binding domain-containing protein, partial [Phycisphaerales bacterium]
MRNSSLIFIAAAVASFWLAACERKPTAGTGAPGSGAGDSPAKKLTIAVIPKGTTHVFWKSVERGAKQAGQDLGAEIIWKGPLVENDRAQQIQLVQQFISDGVGGIVLAPLDKQALVQPVKEAKGKHIPIVIFDSALEGTPGADFAAFVATNNRAAGKMGGEHLVKSLGGSGKVVLLRYQVGSASTDERESGFLDAVKSASGVTVLSDTQYAGPTADEAKAKALN